jgi:hypothetical protein
MPCKDKDKQREYKREYNRKRSRNRTQTIHTRQQQADKRLRVKLDVLTHYGNGKCTCVKCGFSDDRALSIDHINGDGAEQRRNTKMVYHKLHQWLRDNHYPVGYQTLCMNCQWIKRAENREFAFSNPKNNNHTLPMFKKEDNNAS